MHLTPIEAAHRLAPALGLSRGETQVLAAIWAAGEEGLPCESSANAVQRVNIHKLRAKLRTKFGGEWIGTEQTRHPKHPRARIGRYYLKRRLELELRAHAAPPRAPFDWRLGHQNARPGRKAGGLGHEELMALALCAADADAWLSLDDVNAMAAAAGSQTRCRNFGSVIAFDVRAKLSAQGIRVERRAGVHAAWRIHPEDREKIPQDLRAPGLGR